AGRAAFSDYLESGLRRRLERFAALLTEALDTEPATAAELVDAAKDIAAHRLSRQKDRATETAARLLRWLAAAESDTEETTSFEHAARRYAEDISLVDQARGVLYRDDLGPVLAPAVRLLLTRATAVRERFNERFGKLAAGYFEAQSELDGIVPVEDILERVVAPIAKQSRVLLLVLDGLSFAVFHHLLGGLLEKDWEPCVEEARGRADVGVAVLPGVTHASRASLLCGRLQADGSQSVERRGLAGHPALFPGERRLPPRLLHKADLRGEGGLSEEAARVLLNANQRVVAVVHNSVDDVLHTGDQLRLDWAIQELRYLEDVLDAASEAKRTLIIVSDHGHLPESGTEREHAKDAKSRYRAADEKAPGAGEVLVKGKRVLTKSGEVIVQWSEGLRYGSLAA
ncbi:MAG: BREX-2 system phosphatase PglZ, partial [Acidobacteriota bacterium]